MSLQPSNMFGNYMVLQRNKPLKVWGTAEKGTTITVEIQGFTYEKEVDHDGKWIITVESLNASTNETMVITDGKEVIRYTNVAVGEVWLAGGQSNMEFFMKYDKDYNETVKKCENKNIRFFDYPVITTEHDLEIKDDSVFGFWRQCNEENLQYYSAVAYYFAKKLQESIEVPVGIIGCNCGGTRACCWMDEESVKENGQVWLDDYNNGVAAIQDLKKAEEVYNSNKLADKSSPFNAITDKLMYGLPKEEMTEMFNNFQESGASQLIGPWHEWRPAGLYHTMLKKVMPYTIKGVIWYQGESDEAHPEIYADMMCGLIRCWRRDWQDELPFIMSQLAPLGIEIGDGGKVYPIIREQQEEVTRRMKNVFCASIGDVGSTYDIHPKEKQPIGKRMALLARGYVYGEDVLCDAPMPLKAERSQKEITITFIHADNGLKIKGIEVQALKIYNQKHEIIEKSLYKVSVVNNKLLIHFNKEISTKIVEIAFAKDPYYEVNLYNMADIPVKPFTVVI